MSQTTLFPNWKELAKVIAAAEDDKPAGFYTDTDIADLLDTEPGTQDFSFQWMQCRDYLLKTYGIEFMRVKAPIRGYKAMSDTEKVNVGFTRRMKKTRRNANRMSRVVGSVNRNALSADDARAHDQNMAKAGLLEGLLHQLPRGVTSLRVTVDISRDMPGLMP